MSLKNTLRTTNKIFVTVLLLGLYALDCAAATDTQPKRPTQETVQAGHYLASRFAQRQYDWSNAHDFVQHIMESGITTPEILQRAMILSMGSGHPEDAIEIANKVKAQKPQESNTVSEVFLIINAFKTKNYDRALTLFNNLRDDGTTRFIGPFIEGWLYAAMNKVHIKELKNNTIQLYHAILISDFLDNHSDIEKMIDKALKVEDINILEKERIADLYGHVGLKNKAIKLYKSLIEGEAKEINRASLKNKIALLERDKNEPLFGKIETANHGLARALHDIANILYNENNDESARVFAHLSLYLQPDSTNTKFLLAGINSSHDQFKQAIDIYNSVSKDDERYYDAQYLIAEIYEDTEKYDDALALLNRIYQEKQDADTLIRLGNLFRHQEKFTESLTYYNDAVKKLGGTVPDKYWHLHYALGISYEQSGQWEKAEKELKAALEFQPDHPYILNYLGYAWADMGINLEESLAMIKRAVDLRPSDGYITDSLGWVMYQTKDYKNAVPVLERAVELLPDDPTINDHLGDAYWKVGRFLEAKFQWKRAKNNSEDAEQIKEITRKLENGMNE